MKSDFEVLSDELNVLAIDYMDGIIGLPQPYGQVVLDTAWALFRNAKLSVFEKHGWTEVEFDAELDSRLERLMEKLEAEGL